MYVVNEQCNSIAPSLFNNLSFLPPLFVQLIIELDQQQHLVLYVREKVVLPDKIKNVGATQSEIVGESFAILVVSRVSKTLMSVMMKP